MHCSRSKQTNIREEREMPDVNEGRGGEKVKGGKGEMGVSANEEEYE